MKLAKLLLAMLFTTAPLGAVWAQSEGLFARADNIPWPRWQARLSMAASVPWSRGEIAGPEAYGLRPASLGLMSDYYFARLGAADGSASGFRATGGLMVGSRPSLWMVSPAMSGSPLLSADRRLAGDGADSGTLPYVGVGYSGLSGRNGWNFSADFGLAGLPGRSAVRLGRAFNGTPGLEEQVRDLRLWPMLQVGASYSF